MKHGPARFLRLPAVWLLLAVLGCAPYGFVDRKGKEYYFDYAAYATSGDHTVLSLSSELKQSWEYLPTTRHVWILVPVAPVTGRCEIRDGGCQLRFATNLGLTMAMLCAGQADMGKGRCEIDEGFGEWAESGFIRFEHYVENERLEGRFEVVTPSGPLEGEFTAFFDSRVRLERR
ncbi:MAG: hypothetical protein ACE5FL_16540 [Myxococcota bacterium]